ncbi:MAG TPA: pilus assembly protein PilM [Smithellaceae bacterium]
MASLNDINSTEKLLNVIRGKNEEPFRTLGKPEVFLSKKKPAKKIKITLPQHLPDKKRYTIGIDIGQEFIRLAKTTKASDGRPILVDQKVIYSHQASKGSPEFNTLLKSSVIAFCGSIADCNIWTMMTAGEVNVYHIKIPHVQKKQLENVIYWTAKKENPIDEKNFIFDFELQGEIIDQGIPKYSVMVYTVPKVEIEKVKTLFSDMGITLAGISIAPFAIQNIFRSKWMSADEETFASLFIGNDFSRIDIYRKENLVMTRGIKTGTNSMMDAITDSVLEKTGNLKLEKDEVKKILFSLGPDSEKLRDTDAGYDLKEEEILEMIFPAWERLARQIELTLKYYTSSVGYEKVEKLYVSSSMNVYNPVLIYMNDQLGTKTEFFDPFKQQPPSPANESISISERVSLVPALGLALSDNTRTPNAIFTYREKNRDIRVKRINRGIFSSFAAALIICIIALVYQGAEVSILSKQRVKLEKELALYNPILSTDKISKIADEVKTQRNISRQYAQRYLGVAAIGEVTALTPQNIRLINFRITTGSGSPKDNTDKTAKETGDGVIIEGVILGESNVLDSLLAQYVMKLESSPMLRQVSVQKSGNITFKKSEVLHFTLSAKIG